jgi:hypothetical protein
MKHLFHFAMIIALMSMSLPPAQADSPKKSLIERFVNTNATYAEDRDDNFLAFYETSGIKQNAIVLTYHTGQFGLLDAIHKANPALNNSRYRYYGLQDQPLAQLVVDGLVPSSSDNQAFNNGDPSDTLGWSTAIIPGDSPITLTIQQQQSGASVTFKVTVNSSIALQGEKLKLVIAEYYRRSSTVGTNAQLDFRYIARQMSNEAGQLDTNGIDLNMKAGETKEFNFTFTPASSGASAFKTEFLYGVAFVQNDETKEVLQAESSAKSEVLAAVNSSQPLYFKATPGEVISKEVAVVTSLEDAEAVVSIYVDTVGNPIPAGWSVTIEPNEVTKVPGEDMMVTVNVTPGDQSAYYTPSIAAKTKNADAFNIPISRSIIGVLSNSTKNFVSGFSGFTRKGIYTKGIANNILTRTSTMPWIGTLFTEFQDIIDQADLFIVPMGTQPLYLDPQFNFSNPVEKLSEFIDQGKKILIFSNVGLSWAFDEGFPQNQFAGVGNGPLVQEFFDKIGIEFGSNKSRLENQGGGVAITPFTMRGIANNVIGNKLNNNAAINANAFTAANFFAGSYVSSTDIIKITNPNVATPFIYYDSDQKDIAGIHATIGNARVVYVTFPLEILNVSANQQEILRKSVNWLLTGSATSVDEELAEQSNDLLSVTMQPNPVSDRGTVNFSVKGNTPQLLTISLYDALGNEVAKISKGTFEPGNHSVNIPVSNFASGAYRLVVRSLEGSGVHIPVNIVR